MKTITDLSILYPKTDKRQLGYTYTYDRLFGPIRTSVKKVLEIGVGKGDSLRMWRDFFPNASIYGWDISQHWIFQEPRITTKIVNHDDRDKVHSSLVSIGSDIDIVIDDGSHNMDSQQQLLAWCFPFVSAGGIYVIEDLHTSMIEGQYGVKDGRLNTTYKMLTEFQSTRDFMSEYMSAEEREYIKRTTGEIMICGQPAVAYPPFSSFVFSIIFKSV